MVLAKKSQEVHSAFTKYVETGDKSLIKNFTRDEIELTILQCSHHSKGWNFYEAMEMRVAELKELEAKKEEKRKIQTEIFKNVTFKYKDGMYWPQIQNEYEVTKKEFGIKINFVKEKFKRKIIFRDIEQAHMLSMYGFNKPALILAGAVIEELLRLYLISRGISITDDKFAYYIECCEKKGLLKKAIHHQSTAARLFRNIVHLKNETSKNHSISTATAKGAVALIFTIVNDF